MAWNGIDSLVQVFDPAEGPPPLLDCMVPFYEVYIPLMCKRCSDGAFLDHV